MPWPATTLSWRRASAGSQPRACRFSGLADYLANRMADLGLKVEIMDVADKKEPGTAPDARELRLGGSRQVGGRLAGLSAGCFAGWDLRLGARKIKAADFVPIVDGVGAIDAKVGDVGAVIR